MIKLPLKEYSLPIYQEWDRIKAKPPEGFKTWMEYWKAGLPCPHERKPLQNKKL